MSNTQYTPGPSEIGGEGMVAAAEGGPHNEENALLCAMADEAFNVATETGLTPRQLADQRAELLEALERIDGTHENYDSVSEFKNIARNAIAKCKGE